MTERPYVVLSCCVSLDGCLDDTSPQRLILSGADDLDEIDALRATCDAVLVGAGTIRHDDPRLLVRDPQRQAERAARGLPPSPRRVVLSASGDLDPAAQLFRTGPQVPLVYASGPAVAAARRRFGERAEVVDAGAPVDLGRVLADLADRGVERLLVEGGASVLAALLASGAADELRLAVAPFFVGEPGAPRLFADGRFPPDGGRAVLTGVRRLGDVAVLHYGLSHRFTG